MRKSLHAISSWVRAWGFFIGLFAFALVLGWAGRSIQNFFEFNDWVLHTNLVLFQASQMQVQLQRMESAAEGYGLTGHSNFLKLFKEAKSQVRQELQDLTQTVGENKSPQRLLVQIEYLLNLQDSLLLEPSQEHLEQFKKLLNQFVSEEHGHLVERERRARDLAWSAVFQISAGALFAVIFILLSYRSLSRTARANEQQSSLLRHIFDNIEDGLFLTDAKGRIKHFNRAVEQLFGVDLSRYPTVLDFGKDFHVTPEVSPIMRALKGERVNGQEMSIPRPDGVRTMSVNARLVTTPSGSVVGALSISRDVSQQKAIEREWQAAKEAALQASRLKSDYLIHMSHEIRTPMNGVMGMATLLGRTPLTAEQMSYVRTIRSSAESLLVLVNQTLDQAQIEAGQLVLEKADFSIRELMASIRDLFRFKAMSKDVRLKVDVDGALPDRLVGDVHRLRQVLVNLVGNALKYTDQGSVHLQIRWLEPSLGPSRVHVDVTDTGVGIALAAQERLFKPFSRLHDSRRFDTRGTGLGLMISRELVHAMGGEIGLESQLGQGTRFWFEVPLEMAVPTENVKIVSPEEEFIDLPILVGNVLVAEDQTINQAVLLKFLEQLGLQATLVEDGQAALNAVLKGSFDVVLMDCQMAPVDGLEATREIRRREQEHHLAHIPIVAVTAQGHTSERSRCLAAGMDDFVSKPFSLEELAQVLRRYLNLASETEFDVTILNQLAPYKSEGEPLLKFLVREFVHDPKAPLPAMQQALDLGDRKRLTQLAHSLKSAARALGLIQLGQLCAEMESPLTPAEELALRFHSLTQAHARACRWLEVQMPQVLSPTLIQIDGHSL